MSTVSPPVRLERIGPVASISLHEPASRNALTDEVLGLLARLLEEVDATQEVRCLVISGSPDVFASGADIKALLQRSPGEVYDGERARHWATLRRARTPIVASVAGLCLGGGCELAMLADIVVAADTARFGLPETGLGLTPGAGGTQLLPRAVGKAIAMDMVLTGRLLDAHEAARHGLVARVVPASELAEVSRDVAERIAERPPLAQQLAKDAVDAAFEVPLEAGIESERRAFAVAFGSPDAREGLAAFVEKREPAWRNHR